MKKIFFFFALLMAVSNLIAQAPQTFKYQAVVRDAAGGTIGNSIVSMRISILSGSPTGSSVYTETQQPASNEFGVVNLNIGEGTVVSGNFETINWGSNTYFVKIELDALGGSNYEFMGTSQLLSVPYALYSKTSGNSSVDFDTDSTNEIQTINKAGNTVTLSKGGGTYIDSDNQTLSLAGTILSISNSNSIQIGGAADLDWDPNNEIQSLALSNDSLKISGSNTVVLPHDDDNDSTNEIQNLVLSNDTLSITKSNYVVIDKDSTNELQTLTISNDTLTISNGNSVVLPPDDDADSTNELQVISISNDTIYLSNGGYAVLPVPTNAVVPAGSCIQSININPPNGYSFSGNSILHRKGKWNLVSEQNINDPFIYKVTINNKAYFIGYSGTYELDLTNYAWVSKSAMPNVRVQAFYTECNGKIYIIGGYVLGQSGVSFTDIVNEYDPVSDIWTTKAVCPISISMYYNNVNSVISANNKIYLFFGSQYGGSNMSYQGNNIIYEFDPLLNTWQLKYSVLTQVPANGFLAFNLFISNGYIYGIRGFFSLNGQPTKTDASFKYNPVTNVFEWLNNIPFSGNSYGGDVNAFTRNGQLNVIANFIDQPQSQYQNIGYYFIDTANNQWVEVKNNIYLGADPLISSALHSVFGEGNDFVFLFRTNQLYRISDNTLFDIAPLTCILECWQVNGFYYALTSCDNVNYKLYKLEFPIYYMHCAE